jgi:2-polyprenyl-3-methyl-5-hydroxy-6-metoxy-1,4-benzoquinol methylase
MRSAPLQDSQWPEDGLEWVPACPVCGSAHRHVLYDGLRDKVFRAAPGSWRLYDCDACHSAWLDPRPNDASLPMAYAGYFTHDEGSVPVLVRRRGFVRKIIHDALNAYLSQRYGFHRAPLGHAWIAGLLPPLRAAADTLCRHLPLAPEGGRLLDVGCGNGMFLGIARDMGWQAEGLDFDEAAVARTRAQGFNVRSGGIEALDGVIDHFDVVTSSHVLEHVPDPVAHLERIHDVLKPGGLLWLQTPNLGSVGARAFRSNWRGLEPPRHLVLFNHRSLSDALQQAGFADVRRMPNAMEVIEVFTASMAIARDEVVIGSERRKRGLAGQVLVELIEWIWPASREFITVTARKPRRHE